MSRVVFLRSRNSFPEAVRVRMKYICLWVPSKYIFALRRSAWAKLVLLQANVSCPDRSDRQQSWGSRVALPFASYLILRSPPHTFTQLPISVSFFFVSYNMIYQNYSISKFTRPPPLTHS